MEISSERIDDIPLIVKWLKQMDIPKCIDQKLSPPHGNHKGLSYGQLSVLLLTYIITQSDHRLSAVGKGFEVELGKFWFMSETNKRVRWHERYLVVYSQSLAVSTLRGHGVLHVKNLGRLITTSTQLRRQINKQSLPKFLGDNASTATHQ